MYQTLDATTDRQQASRHLPRLRAELGRLGLDGLLVPHEDEYNNEYVPEALDRLAWLTGFTGSAGAAVVLLDQATIFVDGRYTLQVRDQVDDAVFQYADLVEDGGVAGWLGRQTLTNRVIGFDPRLHTPDALARLQAGARKAGAQLRAVSPNPIDLAWGAERPPEPRAPIVPHPLRYAGVAHATKRAEVGRWLTERGADAVVLTAPPSIAWLFNVRGGDVKRSPLPLANALVGADGSAILFVDAAKVSPALVEHLGDEVRLAPPEALAGVLESLKGQRIAVDPAQSGAWVFDRLEVAGAKVLREADPCALPRACKNPVEQEGARQAHRRDGAALTRFLHWVATEGEATLADEATLVAKLEGFRVATGELRDLSFDTIAGAGPNGAIVHYRPTWATNRRIAPGELLLVDSGGQYLDGTTDVTRTVAIGQPSDEHRDRFTRVLRGHIALARVRFPPGTTGHQLDVLARMALWEGGFDYDHGTGHGVGSYLGVHEGPQRIARPLNAVPLKPGMIVSNEPGYYQTGAYGIRMENLQMVTPPEVPPGGERPMLGFEALTLAPIDRRLIDPQALNEAERAWVDAYHARVAREIGPLLEGEAAAWLGEVTRPLQER